jgi:endonuclease YncB( thermonuclease family)
MGNYKVIKGTFHVKGYSPDGDSIRFRADNASHWDFFKWSKKKSRPKNVQLRIEVIDALETHYEGYAQPGAFAIAALETMLEFLNIKIRSYNLSFTKITDAEDGSPGFIAASEVDSFDRPVSFAFTDKVNLKDGAELAPDKLPVKNSFNYQLAKEGLAYPCFYYGLDPKIVKEFQRAFRTARNARRGIWAIDKTKGFTFWHPKTIQEDVIIMPKLFRRLVSFMERNSSISDLSAYMEKTNDYLRIFGNPVQTRLDRLIVISGNHIALNTDLEQIEFKPK